MRLLLELIKLAIALLLLVILLPGAIYLGGLLLVPRMPDPPTRMLGGVQARQIWAQAGGFGIPPAAGNRPMVMQPVDPWSYAWHQVTSCPHFDPDAAAIRACTTYFPGWLPAHAVARAHLHDTGQDRTGEWSDQLSDVALSIWITRQWTPAQVAAWLARRNR